MNADKTRTILVKMFLKQSTYICYHSEACLMLEFRRNPLFPVKVGFSSPTVTSPISLLTAEEAERALAVVIAVNVRS